MEKPKNHESKSSFLEKVNKSFFRLGDINRQTITFMHLNYYVRNNGRYLLRGIFSWRLKVPFLKIVKASLGPIESCKAILVWSLMKYLDTDTQKLYSNVHSFPNNSVSAQMANCLWLHFDLQFLVCFPYSIQE